MFSRSLLASAVLALLPTLAHADEGEAATDSPPPTADPAATAPSPLPAPTTEATASPAPGAATEGAKPAEPFAFADFSWVPGNYGASERPLSFGPFTGEVRVDTVYHYSLANPVDDTISGSSEVFRHGEVQVTQLGFGGDFLYKGMMARVMTQFGMYSQTTPRNDASPSRGQWNLDSAYRYLSEAYGGYHVDALHGVNLQAGIFMSYVGLWSYYNFDNWTYQPSYVSSNTPWFFNGVRAQIFTSDKLKIEPWLVNGWQSYGRFNDAPGGGGQILWRPTGSFSFVANQYVGTDTLGNKGRLRFHTDDSVMVKELEDPSSIVSKAASSLTVDAGCETGDGVSCGSQYFLGFMAYQRFWFAHDHFGLTVGGGAITNPGRYLVLVPPVNGATAASGTPYFTAAPHDKFDAWDMQVTGDYMPKPFVTFRLEFNHRAANVPYFTGHGGVTPPGGNQGALGSNVAGWSPDLVKDENRITAALMVKL
ncbi:MAG: outer membrane beta-barrel protein [Polyangiaceae bacterium]